MKTDKFLIGIVIGIVLLIIVAVVMVLSREQNETFVAEDTPEGVVHNYFLAVQQRDYEKAYGYLSDDLEGKPDLDQFIVQIDGDNETALQIGKTTITGDRASVDIAITTYHRSGGLFDTNHYTYEETAHLRRNANGEWKIFSFPYPYWGYWDEAID